MEPCESNEARLQPATRESYKRAITTLRDSKIPFLIGGAYAFGCYTGITRDTKDFDVFAHPRDVEAILGALAAAGYRAELTDPTWLGKAFNGDDYVDVIFGSGNGIARVDDDWFTYAVEGELLGTPIRLIPAEEMIWSKGFVMTRERYDGADVAHLLRARAEELDWERLLWRYEPDWQVLYNHLILFGYIYPAERKRIPDWVMQKMSERMQEQAEPPELAEHICRGTLLSGSQYVMDIEQWGYQDARELVKSG
jgi:hypothetical protein